jgi:hypothetical protein
VKLPKTTATYCLTIQSFNIDHRPTPDSMGTALVDTNDALDLQAGYAFRKYGARGFAITAPFWLPFPHSYKFRVPICEGEDCSAENVFETMKENGNLVAPGADIAPLEEESEQRIRIGDLIPVGSVTTQVDQASLRFKNSTLPGHVFHRGTVDLELIEEDGPTGKSVFLQVEGKGFGFFGVTNQLVGFPVFFNQGRKIRRELEDSPSRRSSEEKEQQIQ